MKDLEDLTIHDVPPPASSPGLRRFHRGTSLIRNTHIKHAEVTLGLQGYLAHKKHPTTPGLQGHLAHKKHPPP